MTPEMHAAWQRTQDTRAAYVALLRGTDADLAFYAELRAQRHAAWKAANRRYDVYLRACASQ